jgi:shikimate kinase
MTAMNDLPPRIYLIGARGSGKTTVGRLLAARLGWSFVDMDDVIESAAGETIAEIFAGEGEAGFRDREAEALAQVASRPDHVIATGGGIVLRPDSRSRLCGTGYCVWLTAPPETLSERIRVDAATAVRRPALTGLSPLDEMRHVLAAREPLYRSVAHQSIATDTQSPEAVVSAILAACSTSS